MSMIFREGVPGDRGAIASLHISISQRTYGHILSADYLTNTLPEEKVRLWEERLARGIDRGRLCLIVAEDEAGLAGFCCFRFDHEPEFGTYLHNLYVAETHRGQGVARRLLAEGIRRFPDACHALPVHLLTFVENRRARHFYEQLNGRLIGEAQNVSASYPHVRFARYQWTSAREMSQTTEPSRQPLG